MSGFAMSTLQTRDPDVMADMMTNALGALSLSVIDPSTAYLALQSAVGESIATLDFELSFGGRASLDSLERDEMEQTYSIVFLVGNGALWDKHENTLDVHRPVLCPDWVDSEYDGVHSHLVSVSRTAVRDYARLLAGDERFDVGFTHFHAATPQLDQQWYATRRFLLESIQLTATDSETVLFGKGLTELVTASVLATFPNTLRDHLDRHDARPLGATAAVRRAVAYIDEHLQDPVTLPDIVSASRLSVRALNDGFRRHLDTTPMQYLRRSRLEAARRDLLTADPTHETVAAIARRWGFTQLGRFAARYRAAFGESPSDSLRR